VPDHMVSELFYPSDEGSNPPFVSAQRAVWVYHSLLPTSGVIAPIELISALILYFWFIVIGSLFSAGA
jgi:hypothetical protein